MTSFFFGLIIVLNCFVLKTDACGITSDFHANVVKKDMVFTKLFWHLVFPEFFY